MEDERLFAAHAEPVVERGRLTAGERRPERPDAHLVDADGERLACARATHLDRADQRVALVERLVARLERSPGRNVPTGVETREGNRVAALDRQHRREVA